MYSAWTDHLTDPEEKERFKKDILSSKMVFERLSQLLDKIEADLNATELNTKMYDIPNWEYRQADMIGGRRMLNTVRKLINIKESN